MTSRGQIADPKGRLSAEGRRRLLSLPAEPLFVGDWDRALFLHVEIQHELDLIHTWSGKNLCPTWLAEVIHLGAMHHMHKANLLEPL